MIEDSPFSGRFKDDNVEDRRIGIAIVKVFFCDMCQYIWRAGSSECCPKCKCIEIKKIHEYDNKAKRV